MKVSEEFVRRLEGVSGFAIIDKCSIREFLYSTEFLTDEYTRGYLMCKWDWLSETENTKSAFNQFLTFVKSILKLNNKVGA